MFHVTSISGLLGAYSICLTPPVVHSLASGTEPTAILAILPVFVPLSARLGQHPRTGSSLESSTPAVVSQMIARLSAIREQPLRGLSSTSSPVPIQLACVTLAGCPYGAANTDPQTLSNEIMLIIFSDLIRITQLKQSCIHAVARGVV